MTDEQLYARLSEFILTWCLKDQALSLTPSTPLVSSGLLDSLAVTEVLMFLEDLLNLHFDANEADPARFETMELIVKAVRAKTTKGA